jgi:zinc protease
VTETTMLPDVEVVELDNGFKALLVERGPLPVVASLLWYRVGSRDERTGETGVSHFLEHMMFKGTERFAKGQIDLQTSKMGGSNNAFTDNDGTAYYFAMAADRWETALEIEAMAK